MNAVMERVQRQATYTTKCEMMTPDAAARILKNENYEKQRPIRPWHVTNLAAEIEAGRFMPGTQIHFAILGGRRRLVNGQHTLAAIVKIGIPVMLDVKETRVRSESEIADLYFRHDTGLIRNSTDMFRATGLAERHNISPTNLGELAAAAVYLSSKGSKRPLTNDQKLRIVESMMEEGLMALEIIKGATASDRSFLRRKTTLSAIMFCYKAQPDQTLDFWQAVVADDGLRKGDPRKTLLEFFRSTATVNVGAASNSARRPTPDHVLVKGIATAWNAFVERREITFIRTQFDKRVASFKGVGDMLV